jgi:hypothetical protein
MSEVDEFTVQQYFKLKYLLEDINKTAVDLEDINDAPIGLDNENSWSYISGYNAAMQKIKEVLNGQ